MQLCVSSSAALLLLIVFTSASIAADFYVSAPPGAYVDALSQINAVSMFSALVRRSVLMFPRSVSQATSSANSRVFFTANAVYYISAGINVWGTNVRLIDGQGCTFMNMGFKQTWLVSGTTDMVMQNFKVGVSASLGLFSYLQA